MRKNMYGQGASEYLIILAVVLIVALIAIALLGFFPAFGGDARMSESHQYWSSTRPFALVDWVQTGTTLDVSLQNMEAQRLVLLNLTVGNASTSSSGGYTFNGGARKTITITGLRACNATDYDFFEYDVRIVYNTSMLSNAFTGQKPIIGPCNQ